MTNYCGSNLHFSYCENVKQVEKPHTVQISTLEICLPGSTKAEYVYNLCPSISTPKYISNRNAQICALYVGIGAHVFLIVKDEKQAKFPATVEKINCTFAQKSTT